LSLRKHDVTCFSAQDQRGVDKLEEERKVYTTSFIDASKSGTSQMYASGITMEWEQGLSPDIAFWKDEMTFAYQSM